MRDNLLGEIKGLLRQAGFTLSDLGGVKPRTFDLAARRNDMVLMVKALVNIDGFQRETAREIKVLSSHLDASALLIGVKSSHEDLETGVLYLRHGVPAMNTATLREYLIDEVPPLAYMAPGGMYVNVDGDRLEEQRKQDGMSLGQVAKELGVSRRSVSKYQDGMDATLDVGIKLEDIFNGSVISPIEPLDKIELEVDDPSIDDYGFRQGEDVLLGMLQSMGFRVLPTMGTPFRALSEAENESSSAEKVLTGIDDGASGIEKIARVIGSISRITDTKSIYIVNESVNKDRIGETVIIQTEELKGVDESDEFIRDIYQSKSS